MATDPQSLLDDAACYTCYGSNINMLLLMEIALLAQIVAASGGGGSSGSASVTTASGAPPTDGSVTTMFYKDSASGMKYINTGTVAVPTWEAI
jgi:hypothetical protein